MSGWRCAVCDAPADDSGELCAQCHLIAYPMSAGVVEQVAAVTNRGGVKCVWADGDKNVPVNVGLPRILADRPVVTAALSALSGRSA